MLLKWHSITKRLKMYRCTGAYIKEYRRTEMKEIKERNAGTGRKNTPGQKNIFGYEEIAEQSIHLLEEKMPEPFRTALLEEKKVTPPLINTCGM